MAEDLTFDGVIIGSGHNALVLAGYMAKSGLSVAVLEENSFVGGGTGTVESNFIPGFKHEYHSQFHRNIPGTPWWRDLEVDKYGVQYIYPDVNNGMPLSDGRAITVHSDPAKTRESLRRFNAKDADRYFETYHKYQEMALRIQIARDYAPPLPPEEEAELLSKSEMGREFLAINSKSAYEVVHELFDDEALRAFYLFLFSVRGYLPAPTVKGTGFATVAMTYLGNKAMLPRGGSRSLAHGLSWMVAHHGGKIFPAHEVGRILVRNGRAVGVETVDGKMFHARKFVVSTADPHQTFDRFLEPEHHDAAIRDRLANYKYGVAGRSFGVLFALHAGTKEPPRYSSASFDPDIDRAFNTCLGYETSEDLIHHLTQVAEGIVPSAIGLQAACPTIHDPTRAPAGKHVLLAWQFAPFEIREDGTTDWDELKSSYLDKVLARWAQYAPNLDPGAGNILYSFPQTPPDTQRSVMSMREGDFHVGALIPSQLGYNRPFPEVSNYRTYIEGLYVSGASTHPGGNVTGAPGYNAAKVLAEDLGLDLWWKPRDLRQDWASL